MTPPTQERIEAALDAWMAHAAAFMFNTSFGVENSVESWEDRKERLRPWMAAAIAAADRAGWSTDMEAAKKLRALVDLWTGTQRIANCYYDQICDEWRTSRPSGHLFCIPRGCVTHWILPPPVPGDAE